MRDATVQSWLEAGDEERGRVHRATNNREIALDQVFSGDEESTGRRGRHGRVQRGAGQYEVQSGARVEDAQDAEAVLEEVREELRRMHQFQEKIRPSWQR